MPTAKVPRLDLIGQVFGRLTVIAFEYVRDDHHTVYRVRCSCPLGTEKTVTGNALRSGSTVSCGCLAKERRAQRLEAGREARQAAKAQAKEDKKRQREETEEPEPEIAAPRDLMDFWVSEWRRLNSEDENEVKLAKENVRRHMTLICKANAKARDLINGETSENGLADDDL